MNKIQTILNKIKEYNKIFIFRHIRPDGDAVGASLGLAGILRLTYPEKEIRLQNSDFSEKMSFLNDEAGLLPESEYADALGIVVDTATADRVSNKSYRACRELIKIDHHIPVDHYADIEWVEEWRSSCCEMICAFFNDFKDELKMDAECAKYIYTGMVTDSGRFRFNSVSGETMRLAGLLLDYGIDTDTLFANIYLKDEKELRLESYVHKNMKISENGVASILVSKRIQNKFSLSREESGDTVNCLESIRGALIWISFIECDDGTMRVRLRSRFVTINKLAEKYSGGGHACACGATVHSKKEMRALLADADALLAEYKANNDGWM